MSKDKKRKRSRRPTTGQIAASSRALALVLDTIPEDDRDALAQSVIEEQSLVPEIVAARSLLIARQRTLTLATIELDSCDKKNKSLAESKVARAQAAVLETVTVIKHLELAHHTIQPIAPIRSISVTMNGMLDRDAMAATLAELAKDKRVYWAGFAEQPTDRHIDEEGMLRECDRLLGLPCDPGELYDHGEGKTARKK